MNFQENVLQIVSEIPLGKVTTYGSIAQACGLRSSARMVGWILNKAIGQPLPFHRVVNRNGLLTGKQYFETANLMKELLLSEGIEFKGDAINMENHLWIPKFREVK
ncbi:MAG: MGMT family protein [Candidatus Kapabacteria bacterium]|nr:MGMT family protein [Candidatus Kapabacteria bacterium]